MDPNLIHTNTTNHEILKLLHKIKRVLKENFVGMYIHGSFALGDFNFEKSDIDFLVLIDQTLEAKAFGQLQIMHDEFLWENPQWAKRFEGSYVLKGLVENLEPPPAPRAYYNDGRLRYEPYGYEWVLELYVLREHGIVMAGESICEMIPVIEASALKDATQKLLVGTWLPLLEGDSPLQRSDYQQYAVLSMCRALYMQKNGQLVSKEKAANWALSNVDRRFKQIISDANNLTIRTELNPNGSAQNELTQHELTQHELPQFELSQVELTKAFIQYTYDQGNRT